MTRPVFIVGCARSGTTLLQLALHAHPAFAVPPETRFIIPAYERRADFGDPNDRASREAVADFFITQRRRRFEDLDLDGARVREAVRSAEPTIGAMLEAVYRCYADRFGASRWGDKRPAHIERLDVLRRLFPDAQIVHIIRDGRDCVASLKRMPWWQHGTVGAVHKWVEALRLGERAKRQFPPDQYHELRYEDLVADPETTLTLLCTYLAEEFHPEMLAPHRVAGQAVPDRKHWHERTHQPIDDRSVEGWRGSLDQRELRLFESVGWDRLHQYGYEPTHRSRPAPAGQDLLAYARYGTRRRASRAKWKLNDVRTDLRYDHPVAVTHPVEPGRPDS